MRKLLLIMLMGVMGVYVSMAQTARPVPVSGSKTKPIHQSLATQQVKAPKMKVAPVAPLALSNGAKVVSSVSHGDKKIQIVKNSNGAFSKRILRNNAIQKLNRQTMVRRSASATVDTTLFESFEGWDGVNPDWIPDNWTKVSKLGNVYHPEDESNITWHTIEGGWFADPTDGNYLGWICFPYPFDDEGNDIETPAQDEWLISPSFTPVAGDNLVFDVYYDPPFLFLNWGTFEIDMENPTFTIKALISTDGGANWTTLWDPAKDEGYTEENIWDYYDLWHTKIIDLKSYVGKSVKIAFQYVGKDGDNVGLDNIAVRGLNPTALYRRPQGYFYVGLSPDWYSISSANIMLGAAYTPATWLNYSKDANSYSWKLADPDNEEATITSTEVNPTVTYPLYSSNVPVLKASVNTGASSTYFWGTTGGYNLFQAGGSIQTQTRTFGVGNYDLTHDFYYYTSKLGYIFGTTSDNSIESVANYFEKPAHKYILSGVWAPLFVKSCPANTEFTMIIHRIDDYGFLADTIATATCLYANLADDMLNFVGFNTIDPETGLEVTNDYVEIEDAILIEIKGFNNVKGVNLAFLNQEFDTDPTGENNAYIFLSDGSLQYYNGATSLLISMDVTYSYLIADADVFEAPVGGGSKTFKVDSYFSPDGWWLEKDLPDWLSDNITFDETTWNIQYTLKAAPLPAGVAGREDTVKIVTYGADMSILVQQGDVSGIPAVTNVVTDTKVVNQGGNFELTYTLGYSAVSIYNVAGQKIAGYALPATGTLTVPSGNYSKGVYLFNFTGAKGASTVKVMK